MFKRRASKLVASAVIAMLAITGLSALPASAINNGTTPNNSETLNVTKIVTGYGTCTGVLVDAQWIATVASCFTQNPADYAALKTTDPLLGARALFGTDAARKENTGTPITELALYTGTDKRDIVMAKLATPALNTPTMKLATTAPTKDEKLDFIGWGRTKTEWIPREKKIGSFNITAIDAKELNITGYNPTNTSLCLGDSGAPGIRTTPNGQELAALNSRSWQKNCIGSEQTKDGAYATRTDDITPWIQNTINNGRKITGLENYAFIEIRETSATDPKNGYACVTVKDFSQVSGAEVRNDICGEPYISKKWELVETTANSNTFAIRSVHGGQCMTGYAEGQKIDQQKCDFASSAQLWQFISTAKNITKIRNIANGLYLTNNSVSGKDIRPATLERIAQERKQNWTPVVVGKALYNIVPPTQLNSYISIESASVSGRYINHSGAKGTVSAINPNTSAANKQSASWKIVSGLADPRCYSFESMDSPGNYLMGNNEQVAVQTTGGKDLRRFTYCAEQAKFGNGAISFYGYIDAFRSLRMYSDKLYQAAYFNAGYPEADDQTVVVNDTAWKISPAVGNPTP